VVLDLSYESSLFEAPSATTKPAYRITLEDATPPRLLPHRIVNALLVPKHLEGTANYMARVKVKLPLISVSWLFRILTTV